MKNLSLTTLLIIITLGFSSCSVEQDSILQDEVSGKLFEKVSVNRNSDGSYYVDMKLNDGAGVDVSNTDKNATDLNFYPSEEAHSTRNLSENIDLAGEGNFKLGVRNFGSDHKSTITVIDNDIKFNRSTGEEDHLTDYSITNNGDGTFDLDFTVDSDISTEFIYNEDTREYEIHLDPGTSSQLDFTRTFTKEEGEQLRIVFVNHFDDPNGRNSGVSNDKPEVIIDDEVDE